jgi:H2-forming N5,N10-methylenetetrahydromethanopterin dehydrogenase-like enzyme
MPYENGALAQDMGDQGWRTFLHIWHINSRVVVGNAIAATIGATLRFNHTAAQTAASATDAFINFIELQAGTYDFSVVGTKDAAMGICDWYLDGTKIVSLQDWYAAAPAVNTAQTTSVVVAKDGVYRLLCKVNGHNVAPATDYILAFTYFRFVPTA